MMQSTNKMKKNTTTSSPNSLARQPSWGLLRSDFAIESHTLRTFLIGGIFSYDKSIQKIWWDQVKELDELKDPQRVHANFAWRTINVSARYQVFTYLVSSYISQSFFIQRVLKQVVTVGEHHRQLVL